MATPHSTDLHPTTAAPSREAAPDDSQVASVQVLGPLSVRIGGRPVDVGGPKPTLLLALLVARAGAVVSWHALIDGLWGDDPPPTARKAVQVHVSNLRRTLGDDFPLRTSAGGYLLDADAVSIDAQRFERTVDSAGRTVSSDPAAAAAGLRDALAWWSGPAYAGLGDCDALAPTIARLTELRLHAQSLWYEARLRLGQHVEIVGDLDALTTDHPYREDLRRLHMLALYRSGRQTEALRVYSRTRALLVEELGIEPSAELRELHAKILDQSPDLELVVAVDDELHHDRRRANGYELRDRLGADDIGVVYSAYQTSTGREVAVKVILAEYANRPEFVERFEADAQHVAGLEHPHIVSLYDFWRSPEGAYLVMPYVRGGNLRRSIDSTRWAPAAAMRVLDQVGSALGHAHRRGIVHGDLNSTKVLLDDDANAYLFDFGIARRRRSADAASDQGVVDDIRAFGLLVHELFTGSRTGADEPMDSVHWTRDDLPQGLDDVIARAMHADPARRYGRIGDCVRALRQVFGADVTTGPAPPDVDVDVRNPYKGLRAFAEVDADDYFGRDRLVEELWQRTSLNHLTVVVGPSGSGKSSLVKAGLVPRVRREGLRPGRPTLVTEMYPGSYPFEELEAALLRVAVDRPVDLLADLVADDRGLLRATKQILPDDDSDLLLVIDQFEELFSLTADASVRRSFLDSLVTIGRDDRSRVSAVVTMRADFFDHPLEHAAFGELMAAGLVTVAVPDQDDLARAISEPARAAGLELEAGLVPIITRDVAGEPGALPLMQYALTELVGARDGRQLTIDAYERTGGVIGALSSRAEDIFLGLPASARHVAEEVFVHLVAVDEDSDDTRRRVRRSELDAMGFNGTALDVVISAFGSFRLLSFDHDPVTRGQTIEVAHEALIREWPRFRDWIDERREGLVLQRRLQLAAADWERNGRDVSFLLRGGRLEQYQRWAESTDLRVTVHEREFLDEAERREADAIATATRRRHHLVVVFAMLAAVAVGVAAIAIVLRNRADEAAIAAGLAVDEAESQRAIAERATGEAEQLRTAAERRALVDRARAAGLTAADIADEDPEAAVIVGLEGAALADEVAEAVPEVIRGLWHAVSAQWAKTRFVEMRFDAGRQKFGSFGQGVSVSPDGRRGVSTVADEVVGRSELLGGRSASTWTSATAVTDLATGEVVSTLANGDGLPLYSTWDPATGEVVTANGDGSVTWWDSSSGEAVHREQLTDGPLWHVAVDGAHLATSENIDDVDGRSIAVLRDRATLQPIVEVPDALWSTLSPNGRWWATASMQGEIVFHDVRNGAEVFRTQPTGWAQNVLTAADWAGDDDAMWLVRGSALLRIDLAAGGAESVVSPDVVAESGSSTERSWAGAPPHVRTSPDGRLLAVGASNTRVYIRGVDDDQRLAILEGHRAPVDAVDWLPDGSGLVSVDQSGTAVVWDLAGSNRPPLPSVSTSENPITHARFAGGLVLLAGRSGSGVLVDASSGRNVLEFGLATAREDLAVVANETVGVFVAPSDGGLRLYDVGEGRWIREFVVDGIDRPLALSEDGTKLLAGTSASSAAGDEPATVMIDTTTGDVLWRFDRFFTDSALFVGDDVMVAGFRSQRYVNWLIALDASTGQRLAESTRSWTTLAMAASPDGRQIATVRSDGRISMYDLELFLDSPTRRAPAALDTADEPVNQLVYSTDGGTLFGAGRDGAVRAWDASTLEELWSLDAGASTSGPWVHDDLLWFAVPIDAPTGDGDGGFGLAAIPFDQESIAEWAATTVTRNLTDSECQKYLDGRCNVHFDLP